MLLTTLMVVEENKQLVLIPQSPEMLHQDAKLDTLLLKEQEVNANGP